MILEVATLDVRAGLGPSFERDFATASALIRSIPGYLSHELQRCIETEGRYLLLVRWETVSAHTEGFRKSAQYAQWKGLLHPYYNPFPVVEHYRRVPEGPA
jgi:heme-degrading monooxygenase HmoA